MLLITIGDIARLRRMQIAHTSIKGRRDSGKTPKIRRSTEITSGSGIDGGTKAVFIVRVSFIDCSPGPSTKKTSGEKLAFENPAVNILTIYLASSIILETQISDSVVSNEATISWEMLLISIVTLQADEHRARPKVRAKILITRKNDLDRIPEAVDAKEVKAGDRKRGRCFTCRSHGRECHNDRLR